ncbi:putative deoxyribonuclease TATDN1-like protein [Thamnocephalis sphaerospora]|uniref:Putative deoxyribonuclease TATDN1-like protein n=1 Tax=Thamnocephalis sphaerospora TaxID=78915 RepID=A0A4P9XS76_9FUNG|nr:putative deoxyribonuclease TATDN1-like protein [Thamnocephalis sphaerospora]|eukprot:RKP08381.1 putative deoxyribonuclease TATDN1-like protein [Thamnocephalis sphaerospora]
MSIHTSCIDTRLNPVSNGQRVRSANAGCADIGVNLTDPMFRDDLKQVLARAFSVGVEHIMVTGTSLAESAEAIQLVHDEGDGRLSTTVGCHPTRCDEFGQHPDGPDGYFAALLELAASGKTAGTVKAVGECGLDYDRLHFCAKEVQLKYFEKQIEIAEKTGLPMFLHMRAAADDFVDIIRRNRTRFTEGVVHSFTGSLAEMQTCVEQGLFIGVNGCSLKTEENLAVVAQIPEHLLMLETGKYASSGHAPWCDIRPTHAGYAHLAGLEQVAARKKERFEMGLMVKSRNEPNAMRSVLRIVARVRGVDEAHLANVVYENTRRVFT